MYIRLYSGDYQISDLAPDGVMVYNFDIVGLFILFEGVEGSGKSTQARALRRRLSASGVPVLLVKEPGSTVIGDKIGRLLKHRETEIHPLTELLLFAVCRAQLVAEVIRPALDQNYIVISDRYTASTRAYQGYGRGLELQTIETINEIATGGLHPDLIVLLDLEAEEGLRRKGRASTSDRFEREEITFHRRVRQGYLEMANADPEHWLLIDAAQPRKKIGELVWKRVQQSLPVARGQC
ncbi:MAG: Thymidylate kinase [Dehalococcoidia bacterium]|nr:Thymidylate kinase [Chloroflexota bacterium]